MNKLFPKAPLFVIKEKKFSNEEVLLKEAPNYYKQPKEYFKLLVRLISLLRLPDRSRFLDIGCATGDFIYYAKKIFPDFIYHGVDISRAMLKYARRMNPEAEFCYGSILKDSLLKKNYYDIIVCSGVLSIFDDISRPLKEILKSVNDNGNIFIFGIFNDDPIDVIMRYRRVNDSIKRWDKGLNIFSCNTVEDLLRKSGYRMKWKWHIFRLPFALKYRPDDCMRAWTIYTHNDPYQHVNGACQLLNFKVLQIEMKDKNKRISLYRRKKDIV